MLDYAINHLISLGVYSFRGVKVALDCANGSSWNIAKYVDMVVNVIKENGYVAG